MENQSFWQFSDQLRLQNSTFANLSINDSIWATKRPEERRNFDSRVGGNLTKQKGSDFNGFNDGWKNSSSVSQPQKYVNGVFTKETFRKKKNTNTNKDDSSDSKSGGNKNSKDNNNSSVDKRFKTLPPSESLPRNETVGGYIFVCNNDTMQENLKRQLFGLPPRYRDSVRAITPGLPLFLYNYSTHQLHGIFEAASFGGTTHSLKRTQQPVGNLQITFTAGLSEDPTGSVFENEPDETTRDKYIRKERERKVRRRAKGTEVTGDDSVAPAGDVASTDAGDAAANIDDGFNDAFFEDPETANRDAAKRARKEEKRRLRQERAADEKTNARQRAELELLMADEEPKHGGPVRHFDMNDILKSEKHQKRKKSGKSSKVDLAEPTADRQGDQTTFKIDVNDQRFTKLFDSHDYAIDPNDARYKDTLGMKALLEEGRKRRVKKRDRDESDDKDIPQAVQKKAKRGHQGDKELGQLLQKVKGLSSKA